MAGGNLVRETIGKAIDRHLESGDGTLLQRDLDNGRSVLTTKAATDREQFLYDAVQNSKGNGRSVVQTEEQFQAFVRRFEEQKSAAIGDTFALTGEQLAATRATLMHPDSITAINGSAGTGKTAALELVVAITQDYLPKGEKWELRGIATTAAAAKELEASAGIKSSTVAGFLREKENQRVLLEAEVNDLQAKVVKSELKGPEGSRPSTETATLRAVGDRDYGRNQYLFDHDSGGVFKTSGGDLRQRISQTLARTAVRLQQTDSADSDRSGRGAVANALGGIMEKVSRGISHYERVSDQEASAARVALLAQDRNASQADSTTFASSSRLRAELRTKQAQLDNLVRTGNVSGARMLLVMDEASLTGSQDMVNIVRLAQASGARLVLQGDVKQHASVSAGRAFEQLQAAGLHVSHLTETRRFNKATESTQKAVRDIAEGRHAAGFRKLPYREVDADRFVPSTADRYMEVRQQLIGQGVAKPVIGVAVLTNRDRKEINAAVQSRLQAAGVVTGPMHTKEHFDQSKSTKTQTLRAHLLAQAGVDRLAFDRDREALGIKRGQVVNVTGYDIDRGLVQIQSQDGKTQWFDPQKAPGFSAFKLETREYGVGTLVEARAKIYGAAPEGMTRALSKQEQENGLTIANGTRGSIVSIDGAGAAILWSNGDVTRLTNEQIRSIDHAYAHTTQKEQGATTDVEIFAVSKSGARIMSGQAAYVGASRAKRWTEIVTTDHVTMMRNIGAEPAKTTALDIPSSSLVLPSGLGKLQVGVLVGLGKEHAVGDKLVSTAVLRTKDGDIKLAGEDLARALDQSGAKVGDTVGLRTVGMIRVDEPVLDAKGRPTKETVATTLERWQADVIQMRPGRDGQAQQVEGAAPEDRTWAAGVVTSHGRAPYQFKQGSSESYHVQLRTADGERTVWGADLERVVRENKIELGQHVMLEQAGRERVQLPVRDESGQVIAGQTREVTRVTWSMNPLDGLGTTESGRVRLDAVDDQAQGQTKAKPVEIEQVAKEPARGVQPQQSQAEVGKDQSQALAPGREVKQEQEQEQTRERTRDRGMTPDF
jgi:hypothetical protein